PEGIPRSVKWKTADARSPDKLESGGRYRFDLIAEQLADIVPPEVLLGELNTTAKNLLNLKTRLAARGVPERILSFPAIGFDYLPQNLEA
ncbi:type II toxin-antitoxin system HipA family toxin, partial [Pseudoalteromonas sp. SIMBA_148]